MDYLKARDLFSTTMTDKTYHFNSISFEYSKNELLKSLTKKDSAMVFLLGDPGSGKSYLLNYAKDNLKNLKIAKYFTYPFFDEREFLEILFSLVGPNVKKNEYNIDYIVKSLKKEFGELEYAIFIDEAQHLTERNIELIRILSDHKVFQFILAMHKKEGNYILEKPQFKTRNPKVIELGNLNSDEVLRYIQEVLLSENLSDIVSQFKKSHIKDIISYTNKNFRSIKKFLMTLFEIVDEANKKDLKKYSFINTHTITMSAIDTGMLNVK